MQACPKTDTAPVVLMRTGHPVPEPQPHHRKPAGSLPSFLRDAAEERLDARFMEALLASGGQWVEAGQPLEIARFTPGEDLLSLSFDADAPTPELTVRQDEVSGASTLYANGKPLIRVLCHEGRFSLDDVVTMPEPPRARSRRAGPLNAPGNRPFAFPERRAALP